MTLCPCQSDLQYKLCCEPFHLQKASAPTPKALMRSRFSAYVVGAVDYIHKTYAPSCRASQTLASIKNWADSVSFVKLEIIDASNAEFDSSPNTANTATNTMLNAIETHTPAKNEGFVEFIASYIDGSELCKLHEKSRFIFDDQQWFYLDGKITPHANKTIGRNESCPCESGKKFKRCHG